jgi:hypothetical protein
MSTFRSEVASNPYVNSTISDTKFEDIVIRRVIIEEVTQPRNDGTQGSGLYTVPFALSCLPPREWAQMFVKNWDYPPSFTTMHRPTIAKVSGAMVILDGTTIEEVERYHRDTLVLVLAETNRQYREWIAKDNQERMRQQQERNAHKQNVEDVSKRLSFD